MGPLRRRLERFAGIGVLNTLIDVGLFAALVLPLGIVPATLVSTGVAMVFSYVANARFAFDASGLSWRSAAQFLGINAVNFWLIQPVVILAIAAALGAVIDGHDYAVSLAAKVASLVVSLTINFVVYDRFIWPRAHEAGQSG
jgi:putative flippase GtrA